MFFFFSFRVDLLCWHTKESFSEGGIVNKDGSNIVPAFTLVLLFVVMQRDQKQVHKVVRHHSSCRYNFACKAVLKCRPQNAVKQGRKCTTTSAEKGMKTLVILCLTSWQKRFSYFHIGKTNASETCQLQQIGNIIAWWPIDHVLCDTHQQICYRFSETCIQLFECFWWKCYGWWCWQWHSKDVG